MPWQRWTVAESQLQPQICRHAHLRWRAEGRKQELEARDEVKRGKRGIDDTLLLSPCSHPHLTWPPVRPLTLGRHPQQTPERVRSARGHGVPAQGKALLNPFIYTHSDAHSFHSHSICPLDLIIKTQRQISRLVAAAQKQMMPNTWLLCGLSAESSETVATASFAFPLEQKRSYFRD